MWPLRALCLLVWCSGIWCNDCNKTKVYFESHNFYSRLRWDEVKIEGREVLYSVKYQVYGEQLSPMPGCQNIAEPFCDLSSVMTDVRSKYFVKVVADGLCLGEFMRFIPLEKTSLGYPKLSVTTARTTLTVTLMTPMGPQNRSVREISCWESCQDSGKSSINYIVRLTHPKSEAGKVFQNTSGVITLSHLDVNTEYCGVVLYELTHPSIKRQSENTTFCVTLQDKPWIPVFVVSALVALFFLITLSLMLCQQHVTRKRNLPKALQIISMNTTPTFNPDPNVEITTMKVFAESPWNAIKSEQALPEQSKAVSNAGYAAQDYHDQDWHCHSYTNEQVAPVSDQHAQSCTSYSMVVGVMVPQDQEELSTNDSGLGESISPGLSSCTEDDLFQVLSNAEPEDDLVTMEPDSTSELLVLPVSRGSNGKLQFSGLTFLPVVSNINHSSEITPLVARLTPPGERTLLLTDIVSMDESEWTSNESSSDYRKAYVPNGVSQSCLKLPSSETISKVQSSDSMSSYRENWVPGILTDPLTNPRNCLVSDNQLNDLAETKEHVDDSPSDIEAQFLGPWMVQIHG